MRAGPPPPIPHPKSLSLSLGPSTRPPLPETQFNESFLRSVDIKSDARNGFSAAMNRGIDWPPPPPLHFKVTSVRDGLATFMLGETLCPVVNNNKDRRVSLRWRLFWDFYYLQWLGFSNTNCYLRIRAVWQLVCLNKGLILWILWFKSNPTILISSTELTEMLWTLFMNYAVSTHAQT